MRESITQFMWGYQAHFRLSLDQASKSALREIGAGVDPAALLVGFRAAPEASFDYCIEPETEPIATADLAGVLERAMELYEADEESQIWHSDPRVHEMRQNALRDAARGHALCEALAASDAGAGRTYFASRSQRVGDYQVYAVIGVLTRRWELLPALTTRCRDRMAAVPSLAEAVVRHVLSLATRAMAYREPPQDIGRDSSSDTQNITRAASHRFTESIALLAGQWFGTQLHEHLDAVAAQPYEGRTGVGTIVLAAGASEQLTCKVVIDVSFLTNVKVANTRAMRKVLEMSGPDLHVLSDGKGVYGLGRISDSYDPATEGAFEVTVVGRGSWEIKHNGHPLLRVDNTRPRLPRPLLSEERFADTVERLFPGTTRAHASALWGLAQSAAEQEHGTMLVVHQDAPSEARRLVPQAMAVEPVLLTRESLRAISNIDGAILVAPDALCHAVGVILDGAATGEGDPSRGARYNSAVRYRRAAGDKCMVIIVSEDGMINLLPDLKLRVQRERIEAAVADVESAVVGDLDFEVFYRRRAYAETVSFYLDGDQCARVNAATQQVEDHRWETSGMRVGHELLAPHPDMNDSYFI